MFPMTCTEDIGFIPNTYSSTRLAYITRSSPSFEILNLVSYTLWAPVVSASYIKFGPFTTAIELMQFA